MSFEWHYFGAMGTRVGVYTDEPGVVLSVASVFETVEAVCSRFRTDSELSRINRSATDEVEIGEIMLAVLQWADVLRERTDGLVDIGIGAAVRAWGYDRTFDEVIDLDEAPIDRERGSWSLAGRTLVRDGAVTVDLGGIAKGWTADWAVAGTDAWVVNAGGDIRSAHPDTYADVIDTQFGTIARVRVGVGALATSTVTKRRWKVGDDVAHHIIDPRTDAPAHTPIRTASAIAGTAVEAEAAAKAVLLKGADGLAWADAQNWIRAAMVVWADGSVYATTGIELGAAA